MFEAIKSNVSFRFESLSIAVSMKDLKVYSGQTVTEGYWIADTEKFLKMRLCYYLNNVSTYVLWNHSSQSNIK